MTKTTKPPRHAELRRWMARTGTTQTRLAAMLGVNVSHVSRVLSGCRGLSFEAAMNLSLLTGISMAKLVGPGRASRLLKLLGEQQTSATTIPKDSANVAY